MFAFGTMYTNAGKVLSPAPSPKSTEQVINFVEVDNVCDHGTDIYQALLDTYPAPSIGCACVPRVTRLYVVLRGCTVYTAAPGAPTVVACVSCGSHDGRSLFRVCPRGWLRLCLCAYTYLYVASSRVVCARMWKGLGGSSGESRTLCKTFRMLRCAVLCCAVLGSSDGKPGLANVSSAATLL